MDASLLPFFSPHGIVVIGASTSPEKLGFGVARNLLQSGYPGPVHFVSQKPGDLFGRPLYARVDLVPDPVDLAVLLVPPEATPGTIEACGRRGIRAAIIMSSGFREAGEEGAALEQACLDIARTHGVRLLGPNCIGTIDTHFPLDTTFLQPPMPARGHIGFISQSGAFCAAIIDWARGQGFGFSRIISLGNQADVNETDALSVLAEDENTHAIVMYMESISDGRRFVEAAHKVTIRKPVIALKVGRLGSGQRAAASHTGALAASDTAFDAAFEKAGVLRADSAEQMFDWAKTLEIYPIGLPVRGRQSALSTNAQDSTINTHGIAVLTNAGGPGVIAADALENQGLSLAALNESTIKALIDTLPPAASILNPVDMLASASPETYASCLKILLGDENVDGVLLILPPPPMFRADEVAKRIVEVIAAGDGSESRLGKPVVIALMGSSLVENAGAAFQHANIPVFPFPERAASALGALAKRDEFLTDEALGHEDAGTSQWLKGSLANTSLEELLAAYGIESAPIRRAQDLHEANSIANELGYPVVMKIASPDILHKSDVGGVVLNIADSSTLLLAYTKMMERVKAALPTARIEGVLLQKQVADGQEVIVGAVRDPQFGPLMMFGSGGVEVEGLRDVVFALAPLSPSEASKILRRTWAGRKLAGFRNLPPADEQAVVDVLVNLSRLIMDQTSINEIEINPLRVLRQGAVALDIRAK